ncbi:MAG TPA: MFS transporter [Bryobacteraceae bacterium]|nr:MFS transporter [Bryobacteraceae bacterium]
MPYLFLLYLIAYIDRINIGFAGLQMTGDLHFSDAVFGLGSGIFFAGYLLLGIPGAMLVEKWSARKALATTMLVWGCVASSTGLIHTKQEFYVMRVLLGVTEAGFFPGVIAYLGHWYRAEDRAKAVAMFMAAIPVSQVVAAPLSAALMSVHWAGLAGWRWLLILEGAPAVVCGVVSLFYLTDRPSQARWLKPEQRDWLNAALASEQQARSQRESVRWVDALRNRDVLLLAVAYFGGTAGNYGLSLWMPKMIQKLGSLSAVQTSLLSAIPAAFAVPAMLACGWHSDSTGERRWHAALPRIIAGVAMAALALALGSDSVPIALVLYAIATAGVVAAYPALWAIPSAFLGEAAAAAGIGLINSFGNLGGFAGPYLIGWFSSRTGGYSGGQWCMAGALALSGIFALLVRKRRAIA